MLATKDFQKWKWDLVSDLLEGPFNNPSLVKYAIDRTKFVTRIFSFYRPSQRAFSRMPWSTVCCCSGSLSPLPHSLSPYLTSSILIKTLQQDLKFVRMACQLLDVLVSSDVGKEYLRDNNKLIPEIAEMLQQELEASKAPSASLVSSPSSSSALSGQASTVCGLP